MKVFLAGRIAVEVEGVVVEERHFPGRQGRLLFAYLVAEHGRPVPRDELADVLWGDAPPATWEKALSVLVSKLRSVLAESGLDGARALTASFGCYELDLPEGAWVDVLAAQRAANEAESFLEQNKPESATTAAALAESLTRSPFLPGDDGPWVDEKRRELGEVRTRALSALAEASLRMDKPAEAARWAELAVEAEPFRESGYRRLMEAHVAAGNRAEALQVYERCRRLLSEELGTYPSPETESLYRRLLEAPPSRAAADPPEATSTPDRAPPAARRKRPVLKAAALVLVALLAAGTAVVVVATRGGGTKALSAVPSAQVAVVVPKSPPFADDPSAAYQDAVQRWKTEDGISTRVVPVDLNKPLSAQPRVRKAIDDVGLVLLAGQFVGTKFVREFARHPRSRFVVLDPDPINTDGPLYHAVSSNRNTSDVFFIEGPGARLAGFIAGRMSGQDPGKRPVVSEILVNKNVSANVVTNFPQGAREALAGVEVLPPAYARKSSPASTCEAIANAEIEQGSRVVYADAGACSAGALTAVRDHPGVWGIGAVQSLSEPFEPRILGYTVKNIPQEVDWVIRNYLAHTLPSGHHWDIGIERRAVDFVPHTDLIPAKILASYRLYRQKHMPAWKKIPLPNRPPK